MSQTPIVSVPPPPPPRRRRSGIGGFFRGLFIILFSAALGIIGAAALAFYVFGYRPETPIQAGQVAQVQDEIAALRDQNDRLQTEVADLNRGSSGNTEQLQDLDQQLRDLRSEVKQVGALGDQMREYANVAATVQLEARDSRTAVALSVSIQATRYAQLDELQRRTDWLGRFLDRLSDISGDAASDLDAAGTGATDLASTPAITGTVILSPSTAPTTPATTLSPTTLPETATTSVITATPTAATTRTAVPSTRTATTPTP